MKASFDIGQRDGCVTFYRDKTDPRFHGMKFARGEHGLMHHIAKWLNARGFDLIKKRAQKDGHLIGDIYQPYLRCRKPRKDVPHIYIWSGFYQLRGADADWNDGEVTLLLEIDVFGKGQDTMREIATLCRRHPDEMRMECRPATAVA
jgi:hypothetical protein